MLTTTNGRNGMVTEPRHSAKRRKEKENGPSRKKEKNGRLSELTHGAAKGGTEGGRRAGRKEGKQITHLSTSGVFCARRT